MRLAFFALITFCCAFGGFAEERTKRTGAEISNDTAYASLEGLTEGSPKEENGRDADEVQKKVKVENPFTWASSISI